MGSMTMPRKVDIAERLYALDGDRLVKIAEALGRHADGADDAVALRQSLMRHRQMVSPQCIQVLPQSTR